MEETFSYGSEPGKSPAFDQTNWSVVRKAGLIELPEADAARAGLCQTYWYPIYCYVRRLGHSPEDAQDLTQEFFARLLEKNYIRTADREKGKFRSFMLMMLKRFMADQWDKANRQKRGGGLEFTSIDKEQTEMRYRHEPADNLTPDKVYERSWAVSLLDQALKRLQEECIAGGKQRIFEQLKPLLMGEDKARYASVAADFGISESNLKVTVHRLRQRYRELIRAEIARTAGTPQEVDEELRDLFAALS